MPSLLVSDLTISSPDLTESKKLKKKSKKIDDMDLDDVETTAAIPAADELKSEKKKKKKEKKLLDSSEEEKKSSEKKSKKKRKATEEEQESGSDGREDIKEVVNGSVMKKAKVVVEEKKEEENPNALTKFRISDAVKEKLKSKGIEALFPIQAMTFDLVLDGNDLVGRARTGQVTDKVAIFIAELLFEDGNETVHRNNNKQNMIRVSCKSITLYL